jgi:hypothetical protein
MTPGARRFDRGKYPAAGERAGTALAGAMRRSRGDGAVGASVRGGEAPAGLAGELLQHRRVLGRDFVLGERALAEGDLGNSRSKGTSWARACWVRPL